MKKTIKLAVVTALALGATTAFATNGDHLIGLSADSRALGGTGVSYFSGAGNGLTNPALLAKTKQKTQFVFAGTFFDPTVKATTTKASVADPSAGVSKTSSQDFSVVPAISLSHRINNEIVVGLGMYGTAGMGTDWRGSNVTQSPGAPTPNYVDLYNMRSSLMLMQFAPSIAYGTDMFGVGLTAIMQYGALDIGFDTNTSANKHVGNGISNDFGYGYQLGAYYNPTKEITVGAVYKSSIDMEYKDQISKAANAFGYGNTAHGTPKFAAKSDHLEQPAEYGVGLTYENNTYVVTGEVKEIQWGDAKGYKDFGWKDQTVYALGAKYKGDGYSFGIGYNYAENPIPNNTDTTAVWAGGNTNGDTMNMFNYVMFPGTVETTYTMGGGLELTEAMSLCFAYTYSPEVSDTVSVASLTAPTGTLTTKHSQQALTIGAKFNF